MKVTVGSVVYKPNGKRYRYYCKRSWDTLYYSFDGEETWLKSKTLAFKDAESKGLLQEVKQ